MDQDDNELQYLSKKIETYERQLRTLLYHLNSHKQLARRINANPELKKQIVHRPVQLDMFGT